MSAAKQPLATDEAKKADRAERLEIYKLLVEMADRVSQRRQAANSFYLSINTLLISGTAYLEIKMPSWYVILSISVAGISICQYWINSIESYKTLNQAKFAVINDIENELVVKPFVDEWRRLDPDHDGIRHKPFHEVERAVPKIFIVMYIVQALTLLPWSFLWKRVLASAC